MVNELVFAISRMRYIHCYYTQISSIAMTQRLQEQLEEFRDLKRLRAITSLPLKGRSSVRPSGESFARHLTEVYSSTSGPPSSHAGESAPNIGEISAEELRAALARMAKGRCADKHEVFVEMFVKVLVNINM